MKSNSKSDEERLRYTKEDLMGMDSAEGMALARAGESMKPENERLYSDPYAIRFVNPAILNHMKQNPAEAQKLVDRWNYSFPGIANVIASRVRCIDDLVVASNQEGITQLVILGAGYDSRTFRIPEIGNTIRVFEIDQPSIQKRKLEILKAIFTQIPDNVSYIPINLDESSFVSSIEISGFDTTIRTIFVLEGLVMYLMPESVDALLSDIVRCSGKNSRIVFDYYPQSLIEGTHPLPIAENIRMNMISVGEPVLFGIPDNRLVPFMEERGFHQVQDITAADYVSRYFSGSRASRGEVSDILRCAIAEIS